MKFLKKIFWPTILVLSLLLAGCAEASDPPPEVSEATALPDSDAASDEDQILIERTPVPTATPDPISVALTKFAESAGLSDEVILGLTVDDLIDIAVSVLIVLIGLAIGSLINPNHSPSPRSPASTANRRSSQRQPKQQVEAAYLSVSAPYCDRSVGIHQCRSQTYA